MPTRVNGQLWIDSKQPHGLKYHYDNETFQVSPEKVETAPSAFSAGDVIACGKDSSTNKIEFHKARFPQDLENVVGVCSQDTVVGGEFQVLKSGTITVKKTVFYDYEKNNTFNFTPYVGAPVYWFIGRSYSNDGWKYDDSSSYLGKLTVGTPSGIKWGKYQAEESSTDVGYSNLPTIGNIMSVNGDDIKINLNISRFETSLEWNWPSIRFTNSSDDASVITPTKPEGETKYKATLDIRHGLFPNESGDVSTSVMKWMYRCFTDVIALDKDNDTEYTVCPSIDNFYGIKDKEDPSTDRRTVMTVYTPDTMRYSIKGVVNYKFSKK